MEWKFVTRKLNEVIPQEKNPRKITKKQKEALQKSIKNFGIAEPICITKQGVILGGHQRYQILKSSKAKEIPCYECQSDLTELQVQELTVRLNKNIGEWDFDILADLYDVTDLLEWGFNLDDLELEENPDDNSEPTSFQIILNFKSKEGLEAAEGHLRAYADEYDTVYKVRIK